MLCIGFYSEIRNIGEMRHGDSLCTLDNLRIFSYEELSSLGPSDFIWRHISGPALVRVMACCLTAPSNYLNQCWRIIGKVHWHSSEGNFAWDNLAIKPWNQHENNLLKFHSNLSEANDEYSYIWVWASYDYCESPAGTNCVFIVFILKAMSCYIESRCTESI